MIHWEHLTYKPSQLVYSHTQRSAPSPAHALPYGQPLGHTPYDSRYKPLQTAREHLQKASPTL